jgi:hypothetical protein
MMLTGGIDVADGKVIPLDGGLLDGAAAGAVATGTAARLRAGQFDALRATSPSKVRSLRLARMRVASRSHWKVSHLAGVQPSRDARIWATNP